MNRRQFVLNATSVAIVGGTLRRSSAQQIPSDLLQPNLANDPMRPQYHLLPPANWMNDPNGPIYWNDRYHMFYQYNPNGAYWDDMHWGHAVSEDMIHWKHLPVALAPTSDGPDADGCFTGTAVVEDGKVVILYTGIRSKQRDQATVIYSEPRMRETQCLATSLDPELRNWKKLSKPVFTSPPRGMEVNGFRDPSPWRYGEWWYMVVASGIANEGGAVLLYRSKDLHAWDFMHVLSRRGECQTNAADPLDPWEVWECPEFFPLGEKHVLIFSTAGKSYWHSGVLDSVTMRFRREHSGILDYGSFYAAKTQLDKSGNRILWGWITESRGQEEFKAAGWAGLMSLPRVISLTGDGSLRFSVAEEAIKLRGRENTLNLTMDQDRDLHQIESLRIEGCCGEILCTVQKGKDPFSLSICGTDKGQIPWLMIGYDPLLPDQIWIDDRRLPVRQGESEDLELHLYVDGSVIELFVNHQVAFTRRFYYTGSKPRDLCMKWTGKAADLVNLSTWQLSPISTDRLTT